MELLPIDVSERLYEKYAATLTNPLPLTEEMRDCKSRFRATYEKGIVIPGEQLLWIWSAHKKGLDPSEPYDVGVSNALALAMYIFSDREPEFQEKPEGLRSEIEYLGEETKDLHKEIDNLHKRIIADQKNYADKLIGQTEIHAAKIDKLKKEIDDLESRLKDAKSTPEAVKKNDKS